MDLNDVIDECRDVMNCYQLCFIRYSIIAFIIIYSFNTIKVLRDSLKLWLVYNVLPLRVSSSHHSLQMFDHTRHT